MICAQVVSRASPVYLSTSSKAHRLRRPGFTMTEFLVSIGVVALLIAILLPAVQSARESARQMQCRNNLHQIGLALQSYESAFEMWPACGSRAVSWHVAILPQLDRQDLANQVDISSDDPAAAIQGYSLPIYICPSDPAPALFKGKETYAATSYLGNSGRGVLTHGYDGMFIHFAPTFPDVYPEGPVTLSSITDGQSSTAAVSEVLHSLNGVANDRDRLRLVFNTPQGYSQGEHLDFLTRCTEIPSLPLSAGWRGTPTAHGWRWTFGEIGFSTYNHELPPFRPNCFNQTSVQDGIYTAASAHTRLVNVLFVDGHVRPVSQDINESVWRAGGSRNGSESVSNEF